MAEPTGDPYACTHCGDSTWNVRLFPDEGDVSLAPRTVIAVTCTQCGTPAPRTHPYWPHGRGEDDAPCPHCGEEDCERSCTGAIVEDAGEEEA